MVTPNYVKQEADLYPEPNLDFTHEPELPPEYSAQQVLWELNQPRMGLSLEQMLRTPRYARTLNEEVLAQQLQQVQGAYRDEHGNIIVYVGTGGPLFSSHTDTVHPDDERTPYRLNLSGNHTLRRAYGGVLGADCAAGIWLMLCMIEAEVPGTYVFHRDEEVGGLGSQHAANAGELPEHRHCIAFDRGGTGSVITHQLGGMRTCSDDFAEELRQAIMQVGGPSLQLDDTGIFTDSANYAATVPECTNISVGYSNEHTSHECLNMQYLLRLRDALLLVPWDTLGTYRVPSEQAPEGSVEALLELIESYPEDFVQFLWVEQIDIAKVTDDFGRYLDAELQ